MVVQPVTDHGVRALLGGRRRWVLTILIVLTLTLALWWSRWHGLDYPAQLYRVGLVHRQGFSVWDANWYGGHYTPAYGVLVPWIGSVVGLSATAIISTLSSVVLFERLLTHARAPHVVAGTSAFTLMMLINMYEGRLPFALGVTLALISVTVARRGLWWWAAGAALLTTLASPVAGAFLALAFAAWALSLPWESLSVLVRMPQVAVAGLAFFTTTAISLTFPEGGYFPYGWVDLLLGLGACAVAIWVLPPSQAALRWGFVLVVIVAIPLWAIANPMGGNVSRLAVIGAPLMLAVPRRNVRVHVLVGLVLLGWQMKPLLHLPAAVEDPSASRSYYEPLVNQLKMRTSGPVRVEIPMTVGHWEAAYVAPAFPLARGWERQLDLRYNAVLYDEKMTATQYQTWLLANGVSYVAIPDAALEPEAQHEAEVAGSAPFLHEVWTNAHWRLFAVAGSPHLTSGPANLLSLRDGRVVLDVTGTTAVTIRMRFTSHLEVAHGHGCLSASPEGWTVLEPAKTGRFLLRTALIAEQPAACKP